LTIADAGISALDDGVAEVAVAFSSNPQVSRPDIVTLRDDRAMIYPDRVVPVVRRRLLRGYGKAAVDIRRRLNAASSALTTLALRGLNQAVIDGRLPEAVGGEFIDANGLGGVSSRREGKRIVVGYMAFAENETLAHLYAEALRAGGFRVIVRPVGGLRPQAVAKLRSRKIDLYPAYDGSLLRYLVGTSPARLKPGLTRTLARIGAEPLRLSRAQNRNVFVTKTDTASRLSLARISDLARYWQRAGQ
jgi:glycine betaine/choline ABC-type transport system substrate-binding protein